MAFGYGWHTSLFCQPNSNVLVPAEILLVVIYIQRWNRMD